MDTIYAAKASAERYQMALEASGIGIWDNDLLTSEVFLSGYGHQLFGFSKEDHVTPEELLQHIHPDDREQNKAKINASLDAGTRSSYENEYRVINPADGQVRWVRTKGRAYFTEIGTPFRFTGTVQDITAEVRARESRQKLLTLVDNSIELMSILENNQINSYLNKAGMDMLGFDNMEQVANTPISDLHAPEDIAFVQANVLPSVMETGRWSGVMNVRHLKTGEIFPVYNNTIRIHDSVTGEPIAVGAVMRDMRPEVAAKKALEESEKNFRTLVMQAPVGILILRAADFVAEIANDSFLEIASTTREALIGRPVLETFPEATRQGFDQMLRTVLETGQPFYGKEVEVVQERNGQRRTVYVDFTFQPLREGDGAITRIMDLSIDVTDKVLARKQLQQNEEELQKRVAERTAELEKKNRELEEYTYVTSHDLQEPIRKIKMFREMIRERDYDKLSEFSKERFDKVGESVERMSRSLKDLLNFASLNAQELAEEVNLNSVLEQVEADLELLIEQKGAIVERETLPSLRAVPQHMHQLFYNLLSNALKFSKQNIAPVIAVTAKQLSTDEKENLAGLNAAREYIHVCVQDNGIGFEQEKAQKIFALFQRLHSRQEYSGTGIGLALCKKVVLNHEGLIWAESEPGSGARFHVVLPVA